MIDGHIHVGKWSDRFFGLECRLSGVDEVLSDCGLEGAVVTATDLRDNESVLRQLDECKLKYWFFPWVDPGDPDGIRKISDWGPVVTGLKFHPSCDGVRITDPRVEPWFEYAEENNLPILVHCGRWQEMSSYRFALEAAGAHPGVRFVFAHMGGDQPELVKATFEALSDDGPTNVWLGTEGIREFWLIRKAMDAVGAERMVFGSDYPIGHPKMYVGLLEALDLTPEERRWITRESILAVLSGQTG